MVGLRLIGWVALAGVDVGLVGRITGVDVGLVGRITGAGVLVRPVAGGGARVAAPVTPGPPLLGARVGQCDTATAPAHG